MSWASPAIDPRIKKKVKNPSFRSGKTLEKPNESALYPVFHGGSSLFSYALCIAPRRDWSRTMLKSSFPSFVNCAFGSKFDSVMEHRNETSYLSLLTMHGTNLVKVYLINPLSNVRETVALTLGVLYTATTTVLAAQTVYYDHICKIEIDEVGQEHAFKKETQVGSDSAGRASEVNEYQESGFIPINGEINKSISSPISVASPVGSYGSIGRELYYKSARSLSASPAPTVGSWLAHSRELCRTPSSKMPPFLTEEEASQEPLLCSVSSSPPLNIKSTLCVASSMAFFMGTYCLQFSAKSASNKSTRGTVIPIARKLLQYNALDTSLIESGGSTGIGSYLGWAMAAIYMGGRLPQIWLNGLSPFMFIFALLGNATYVGSILVNSMEWSSIRPNLPWLVDAGGCVLLDAFVSLFLLVA
ncbi:hypothetical protein AXF42_Ash012498 [Apostasia shenzhenica]|uniref:Uncharacterized protein n=1 Tax=Apostasia shenzhenica TaxID=1088818 RepID=A0A2I0AQY4_9ASPA|nr:hypothetical protein AXF42_Ash012498 [Apostasia shenzhenica]